jgi:integrase
MGLRFRNLRHHVTTELVESQASDSNIMALAGHVSRKMLEPYSHVRKEAKARGRKCAVREGASDGHNQGLRHKLQYKR